MLLSKAKTKPTPAVEKAQLFGVKVVFLEDVNLALSRKCNSVASVKDFYPARCERTWKFPRAFHLSYKLKLLGNFHVHAAQMKRNFRVLLFSSNKAEEHGNVHVLFTGLT